MTWLPGNAIFYVSHNYDYDTPLATSASKIPYGTNGFIVVQKGGTASLFREGQAVAGGWTDPITFQSQVGVKCIQDGTCDPENAPTVGDPIARVEVSLEENGGWLAWFSLISSKRPAGNPGVAFLFWGNVGGS